MTAPGIPTGFACLPSVRVWTASLLLFAGCQNFLLDAQERIRTLLTPSSGISESNEESSLIVIPKGERARRLWLLTYGPKFGLNLQSEVDVVCTCTCCGDRCTMGAACCCSAKKIPVSRPKGVCYLLASCGKSSPPMQIPADERKWYFPPDPLAGIHLFLFAMIHSYPDEFQLENPLEPPSPVPDSLMV